MQLALHADHSIKKKVYIYISIYKEVYNVQVTKEVV